MPEIASSQRFQFRTGETAAVEFLRHKVVFVQGSHLTSLFPQNKQMPAFTD
jgi:hypothetical protein